MHRHDHQCQRRPKTFCRYGIDGRDRQRAGFCRAACGDSCRAWIGSPSRRTASSGSSACRATARSCPTTSWSACTRRGARWARACRWPVRAPASGVIPLWVCGRWRCARICARRSSKRHAQDRGLDRAAWCRHRRLAGSAGRSVFQREHAGRCGSRRAHCVATSRRVTFLTAHRESISAIVEAYGFGRTCS